MDTLEQAWERGRQWAADGKPGSGWCHYDSYLEEDLVDAWWAGYEAGRLELQDRFRSRKQRPDD